MAVAYTTSVESLAASSLGGGFFEGWSSPPSSQEHLDLLWNSTHVVIASDGGKVVGFTTAICDGVLSAYIPLLEVLPAYRGRGIGSELIRRLPVEVGSLYMIDVACDLATLPFYERLGFSARTSATMRNWLAGQGDWRSCDHVPAVWGRWHSSLQLTLGDALGIRGHQRRGCDQRSNAGTQTPFVRASIH